MRKTTGTSSGPARETPRQDQHQMAGLCLSDAPGSRGPEGNTTQATETQYPVLLPIKYIQRSTWVWPLSLRVGGLAWEWSGRHPLVPPSSCLSRLPWEVASESQILGFTVISLKKPQKTTQFFFKGFPCSNLHLEKQLKLFFRIGQEVLSSNGIN